MAKLNVGCGMFPQKGWLNIDANPVTAPEADLYVDLNQPLSTQVLSIGWASNLPLTGLFDSVFCGHVLEHIRHEDVVPFLYDLRKIMAPGARIGVVGPDIFRARQGGYSDDVVHACYGDPARWDGTGEPHVWTCSEKGVVEVLEQAGFIEVEGIDIRDLDDEWPTVSRAWWQCAATARNPNF
jgi:hypothetical protein